ncbi:MAG: class I adenylate-forming enzyme family protein [Hyphomicrobiaceae bacterium]
MTLPRTRKVHPGQTFNMAAYAISRAALDTPDKAALIVIADADAAAPSEVWTYARLERAVLSVAAGLRDKDYERGSRIAIRLDNTSLYPIVFFGAIAAGYVPLAMSAALTQREADFLIRDSGASAVVIAPELPRDSVPDGVDAISTADVAAWITQMPSSTYAFTKGDDPAFLIYTSGTTAQPKGVLHAHRSIVGRIPMIEGWYGLTEQDRVLHAGAFNWTYTLGTGLTDPWANGATAIVFTGHKDPALWPKLIAQTQATIFAAVPTVFRQILKYGAPSAANLGKLRHGLIAGETPPADLFDAWRDATGLELYEALGQSELSTYISTSPTVPRVPGSVGKPQAGRRVAILAVDGGDTPLPAGEIGLLAVHRSDPGLMLRYWNRPAEDAAVTRAEWFVGGDLASIDEAGYVWHRGRGDDVMKVLGYRVSPQEVEAVLAEHPDVAEVACTAVKVRADISIVGAFIVPREGTEPDPTAILAFAAERLADYKRPKQVVFVQSLPRTANGKIQRSALVKG